MNWNASQTDKLTQGLALLLRDETYAAHEVWEELWHDCRRSQDPDQQRVGMLLRVLIQIAAGLHLRQQSKFSGASAVFDRARKNAQHLEHSAGDDAVKSGDAPADGAHRQPRLLGLPLTALARACQQAAESPDRDPRLDPHLPWRDLLAAWERGEVDLPTNSREP
jgi:Domain of unknown function (DUF309)